VQQEQLVRLEQQQEQQERLQQEQQLEQRHQLVLHQQLEQQQEQLEQQRQQLEQLELEFLFYRKLPKRLPTKKRLLEFFSFYFLKRLANHLTVI
jgi:hypothetical protein